MVGGIEEAVAQAAKLSGHGDEAAEQAAAAPDAEAQTAEAAPQAAS
jgi:hypothetical protein